VPNYGSDYVGGLTIIGAHGEVMSGPDAIAEMHAQQISGWPDDEIVGQAQQLVRMSPGLTSARTMQRFPRVANLIRTGLMRPMFPFPAAPPSQLVPPGQPGPRVVDVPPGPVGLALIPMNSAGPIAAGATAVITVQPQSIFKPYRLTVDPVIAAFFLIQNLQVGTVPLFDAPGAVPASNFPPNLQQGNLKKVTATPGIALTMSVTNRDGVAHPFFSTMFGEAAPPACG
jgi:hypothetical protein